MKVGELRKQLEGVDDDLEVTVTRTEARFTKTFVRPPIGVASCAEFGVWLVDRKGGRWLKNGSGGGRRWEGSEQEAREIIADRRPHYPDTTYEVRRLSDGARQSAGGGDNG